MDHARLLREIRLLKLYAIGSSILLCLLAATAFLPPQAQRFGIIDVERINVIEPDGRLALVISNGANIPGPILEHEELPAELSSGRIGSAGMLFYNARGDEVGGLTFRGEESDRGYAASGMLAFDQFKQDQVVAMQYSDRGTSRAAGLTVWDRSTTIGVKELVDLILASRQEAGAARDAAEARLAELRRDGNLSAQRVFLGSRDRTAALQINDTAGRPRIRLYVDADDVARLELLDEAGEVQHTWPEGSR